MNILLSIYSDMILSIHQGNYRGNISVSKPLFILSIIEIKDKKYLIENKIVSDDSVLKDTFADLYNRYNGNTNGTQSSLFLKPYYHLSSSDFYHLVWKDGIKPPSTSSCPSAKYLRENLLYAKLDDDLWELLQDADNREYLRCKITNNYLTK